METQQTQKKQRVFKIAASATVVDNSLNEYERFWKSIEGTGKPNQLQRYEAKNSPDYIKKFIAIGGGPKMGVTLEKFARARFPCLQPRSKGKEESGYDHCTVLTDKTIPAEQKSSGHWGEDDFTWQHVEPEHKWQYLLLCGIGYMEIKFWVMDRKTFNKLFSEGKITNQGNKKEESYQGTWFAYSDVKDFIFEIKTNDELVAFATKLEIYV